jgi:hypothetical protein
LSRRLLLLLPAQRGEEIKSRSRDAAQHPSYDTPRSRKRETECEERQVVEPAWFFATAALQNVARMKPTGPARTRSGSLPGFRCAPPGLRRKRKNRKRNADRRNAYSAVPYGHGRAWSARRTSIGVPPRFLLRRPNATAQLQSERSMRKVLILSGFLRRPLRSPTLSPTCLHALAPDHGGGKRRADYERRRQRPFHCRARASL